MALALALAWTPAAVGGPPESPAPDTAPEMAPEWTLADAVSLTPGATCLHTETLVEGIRSWRDDDALAQRVTVVVHGDTDDPRRVGFDVHVDTHIAVHRDFERAPERCADLHAVLALAIAIALDDTLATELGIVPPPSPVPVEVDTPPPIEAGEGDLPDFEDPRPPERRARPRMGLSAVAGLYAGVAPRLSAGGALSFDVWPTDHLDIRIGVSTTHLPGYPLGAGTVATSIATGRFDLCWGTAPLAVRLRLCAGFAGGASVSQGRGYSSNFRRALPWFAGIVGVDVLVHLVGPLGLEIRIEGVVPTLRTELEVDSEAGANIDTVRFPPIGLVVSVGPRINF